MWTYKLYFTCCLNAQGCDSLSFPFYSLSIEESLMQRHSYLWSCKETTFSSSRVFNNLLVSLDVPYTLLRLANLRGQTRANGPVELLSTWGEIINRKVKYLLFNHLSMRSWLSIIESFAKTKSIHIINTLLAWELSIWSYCYILENKSQRTFIYERLKKVRNLLKRSTK